MPMKHISEFLVIRRRELERVRQISLFDATPEKGSVEWGTFNSLRDDTIDGYPVLISQKPIVVAEPHHILRIVYPRPKQA
ncbi:MAG: hypothetical protein Q7S01_05790 [bacterium]|nr:hypothetical protein [bacterium]